MLSPRLALPLAATFALACSGSNFELGSAPEPVARDTGVVSTPADTGAADPTDTGPTEPVCDVKAPSLACATPGSNYSPQFQYAGVSELTPLVDNHTSHAISYVTARDGRHEKMILRLRRVALTGSTVGRLTLTAYRTPCAGVHVPLGKSRSFDAAAINDGDISFYFNDDATLLPLYPAGTRLTFVLSTDSTAYAFQLIGNESAEGAPASLEWYVKKDDGPWSAPSPARPSAQAWLRDCPS